MPADPVSAFNTRSGASATMVNNTIQAAGFTWPGIMLWDDMRTAD